MVDFKKAVEREYTHKVASYAKRDEERWLSPTYTSIVLQQYVEEIHPQKILELGVGTGRYFPYLSGTHYTGVDISPEMLSYANDRKSILFKRGFTDIFLEEMELGEFLSSLPDAEYDFVFSIGCIGYHVDVTIQLINNVSRVIRPGGYLFLQTTQQSVKYKLTSIIKRWKNLLLGRDDNSHFFISTTIHQLRNVSKKGGFDLVRMHEDEKKWYDKPLLLSLFKKR